MCWGFDNFGQRLDPMQVSGISDATAIAIGEDQSQGAPHTCAVLESGGVVCWGTNQSGQLGNGSMLDLEVPMQVSGIADAMALAAGPGHTCAVLVDGEVMCWGANESGQLGNGTSGPLDGEVIPVMVSGIQNATDITAGGFHSLYGFSCALLSDGAISCWGTGAAENGANSVVPVTVPGIADATAIAAGDAHVCAVLAGGSVMCWEPGAPPAPVTGMADATAITASGWGDDSCAVREGGDVVCWKVGEGWDDALMPSKVLGIADATAVSMKVEYQGCALLSDGGVVCFNTFGTGSPLDTIAGLVAGGPTGTPAPALATMAVSWDGSSCAFNTSSVVGAGNTRLAIDSQTEELVVGTLLHIAEGHTLDEAAAFVDTYDGASQPPEWLVFVAEVSNDSFGNDSEELLDLTAGTYGAFCFDDGLAGYVMADDQLVIEP